MSKIKCFVEMRKTSFELRFDESIQIKKIMEIQRTLNSKFEEKNYLSNSKSSCYVQVDVGSDFRYFYILRIKTQDYHLLLPDILKVLAQNSILYTIKDFRS